MSHESQVKREILREMLVIYMKATAPHQVKMYRKLLKEFNEA